MILSSWILGGFNTMLQRTITECFVQCNNYFQKYLISLIIKDLDKFNYDIIGPLFY